MVFKINFVSSCSNSPKWIVYTTIAHTIKVGKGDEIYVLRPLIDHVSIVLRRDSAALKTPGFGMTPEEFWKDLPGLIQGYKNDTGDTTIKGIKPPQQYKVGLEMPLGGNKATLRLFAKPTDEKAGPIRLEFNPRRFDADSPKKLLEWWEKLTAGQVQLIALLHDARVTRVDIAVDVLNLPFHDLVVRSKKVRKTWSVASDDASVETLLFFKGKNAMGSPKRRADLQIYDKRKQRIAKDRQPKWGDTPHLRIEATARSPNGLWRNLPALKFPFADFEFRRVPSGKGPQVNQLRTFADAGRFRGWQEALELVPEINQSELMEAFDQMPQDLITEPLLWKHWFDAIGGAHLVTLIPLKTS